MFPPHDVHPGYSSVHPYGAFGYQEYQHIDRSFTQRPSEPASRNAINSKAPAMSTSTTELRYKRKIFDHEAPKTPKEGQKEQEKSTAARVRQLTRSPTAQVLGSTPLETIQEEPTQTPQTLQEQQTAALNALYASQVPYSDISCILDASANEGGLYLGNIKAATDVNILQRYNIRAVLNITTQDNAATYKNTAVTAYKYIEALDGETVDLAKDFDSCIKFIENARKNRINVLVHCMAGISRSSTMVIAYMMSTSKLSYHEALKYTRRRRPIVRPNNGFVYQLEEFGRKLREDEPRVTSYKGMKRGYTWF